MRYRMSIWVVLATLALPAGTAAAVAVAGDAAAVGGIDGDLVALCWGSGDMKCWLRVYDCSEKLGYCVWDCWSQYDHPQCPEPVSFAETHAASLGDILAACWGSGGEPECWLRIYECSATVACTWDCVTGAHEPQCPVPVETQAAQAETARGRGGDLLAVCWGNGELSCWVVVKEDGRVWTCWDLDSPGCPSLPFVESAAQASRAALVGGDVVALCWGSGGEPECWFRIYECDGSYCVWECTNPHQSTGCPDPIGVTSTSAVAARAGPTVCAGTEDVPCLLAVTVGTCADGSGWCYSVCMSMPSPPPPCKEHEVGGASAAAVSGPTLCVGSGGGCWLTATAGACEAAGWCYSVCMDDEHWDCREKRIAGAAVA